MNERFNLLENCADIGALRPALHTLCSRYGSVARLDILSASQAGKLQALCFLRMGSAEQEVQLMSELGVGRFGGDLVIIVNLRASEKVSVDAMDHAPTMSTHQPMGAGPAMTAMRAQTA